MHALNLGILAHVDAGKTSLTERLLYAAGAIGAIGRVDDGNTQTDSLALERQRGITIKSAVASFNLRGLTINLIDTPGHPDFIAEVERVLSALDGVILVISAVEGVQAQTRVLMRTLQRLRIPSLIFVNKIDRGGANYDDVLRGIADKLTPAAVSMGTVSAQGTRTARFDEHDGGSLPARLLDVLTRNDDALLAEYVTNRTVTSQRLWNALVAQTRNALVHPVFAGSAVTGAGIEQLTAAITELLPAAAGDPAATVRGTAFKVERGPAGQKVALVRLNSGTVHTRDRLQFGDGGEAKVSAINVFDSGSAHHSGTVEAGQIARLWGLDGIQVGDSIGEFQAGAARHYFAPPTLETAVVPVNPRDKGALHTALSQLAEQDPLINLRQDDRGELFLSLYGEVQKEVIQATLIGHYGIAAEFRETTMICIERPIGRGHALEEAPDPFVATIGLRVEPRDIDSGVEFRLAVDRGSIPAAFFTAVEDAVRETLRQGLHGWRVTDCTVTMTHSIRYRDWAQSNPSEHRRLTPLVLMAALHDAGTVACEPVHRFTIEAPPDAIAPLLTLLAKLQALNQPASAQGVLRGDIPASRLHRLQQALPGLTHGEGVLESAFERFRPVRGKPPFRPRTGPNPFNRKN
ncbi:TetM/TetW/TetO/TetS family tetracycline resistance ribosomal protection protein [Arthrobacter sp. H5]|uniref:elongation factor G n=1 Tax=Arthrobacter sp. H5 TaxID=1267973 RepID=UPI0004853B5D|nr:TetM/TetW/TetO/TetS family tetracycline resistance ribosomal protection protein [Arthrobacter sp. H5]